MIEESPAYGQDGYQVHHVRYRYSDMNSTNTRFDKILAAGSQRARIMTWWFYAVISMMVSAFVLVLLLSILVKRKVRSNPFNLFLVFLIIPDFVLSFVCGITCILNIRSRDYVSEAWCYGQAF